MLLAPVMSCAFAVAGYLLGGGLWLTLAGFFVVGPLVILLLAFLLGGPPRDKADERAAPKGDVSGQAADR